MYYAFGKELAIIENRRNPDGPINPRQKKRSYFVLAFDYCHLLIYNIIICIQYFLSFCIFKYNNIIRHLNTMFLRKFDKHFKCVFNVILYQYNNKIQLTQYIKMVIHVSKYLHYKLSVKN